MKKKRILLITVIFALLICFFCFLPKEKEESVKKKIKTISYERPEFKERYNLYKSKHPHLTKEEIITLVNMNRDYDFYDHIIKQEHPNDLNTIVNKYYQLDENYAPDDLVEINNRAKKYGLPYRKHTARKVLYDDFIALQEACYQKGFELYVTSGYRSTLWQKEIYNHMAETYDVAKADETCSRPGHSEHTTGLGLDVALDQYKYEDVVNHPCYKWFYFTLPKG